MTNTTHDYNVYKHLNVPDTSDVNRRDVQRFVPWAGTKIAPLPALSSSGGVYFTTQLKIPKGPMRTYYIENWTDSILFILPGGVTAQAGDQAIQTALYRIPPYHTDLIEVDVDQTSISIVAFCYGNDYDRVRVISKLLPVLWFSDQRAPVRQVIVSSEPSGNIWTPGPLVSTFVRRYDSYDLNAWNIDYTPLWHLGIADGSSFTISTVDLSGADKVICVVGLLAGSGNLTMQRSTHLSTVTLTTVAMDTITFTATLGGNGGVGVSTVPSVNTEDIVLTNVSGAPITPTDVAVYGIIHT